MRKYLLLLPLLWSTAVFAACPNATVQVKDNLGNTPNMEITNGTGTNCVGEIALVLGGALVSTSNGVPVIQGTAANLNATIVGTGTFAVQAAQSGTWNITNVSGTVSLPTGAATSANQPTNAAQGSTTSGQTGNLIQGAVLTSAPTYTTAQTSPLTLTTAGALRVDGSGATQPVSGTVTANQGGTWNITNISGTVSLPTGASTSANQPSNAAQGSTTSGQTGNLIQGAVTTAAPTYTTAQTDPLSLTTGGALRSDLTTIAGNAPKVGSGNGSSTGSLNVYIATDQPSLTTPLNTNTAQIAGTTTAVNNGTSGAGNQRVNIASDNSAVSGFGVAATGAAVPANAVYNGANGSGNLTGLTVCDNWTPINNAGASTNLKLVTKATSKQVYICSINIVAAAANNVALVEGTKTTNECDTSTAGMAGGATAATGWNFAANGGLAQGSGLGVIARTATTNHDVCLLFSAANQVSGVISWTQY